MMMLRGEGCRLKTGNMSELLFDQAAAQPDKLAIVIPHDLEARPWCRNETYTFASSTSLHEP